MAVDFQRELDKLLALETEPLPVFALEETAEAGRKLLASLNRKQAEIALQVEELYELASEEDGEALEEALREEQRRSERLVEAAVGLCDLLETFAGYARSSGDEALDRQAGILWNNGRGLLEGAELSPLGREGETLDPAIHTVQAVLDSPLPREQVTQVLRSGYRYRGEVVRRAVVTVSSGLPEKGGPHGSDCWN